MPDYSKSIIYKICSTDDDVEDFYIGSTTNFRRRKCFHKNAVNNKNLKQYTYKVYEYIRRNSGWNSWGIVKICDVKAKSKRHLHSIERQFIEEWGATLNSQVPGRTQKQYYEETKERRLKVCAKYRQKNKEKIRQYHRKRRQIAVTPFRNIATASATFVHFWIKLIFIL